MEEVRGAGLVGAAAESGGRGEEISVKALLLPLARVIEAKLGELLLGSLL